MSLLLVSALELAAVKYEPLGLVVLGPCYVLGNAWVLVPMCLRLCNDIGKKQKVRFNMRFL